MEFKLPLVIHCDDLFLPFLNFTVLGARCLAFAFRIILRNADNFHLDSKTDRGPF